ncbi:unnamed protein product [Protopolystoma xenopodis]|uniref:Uncharacterized protein n=1 Tax=Protopolystoma xenopodis TaxID=117903 RepID=A0A448WNZ0_9PLAT|nr:unnamed protein product [Protopolystoma xenopodis]
MTDRSHFELQRGKQKSASLLMMPAFALLLLILPLLLMKMGPSILCSSLSLCPFPTDTGKLTCAGKGHTKDGNSWMDGRNVGKVKRREGITRTAESWIAKGHRVTHMCKCVTMATGQSRHRNAVRLRIADENEADEDAGLRQKRQRLAGFGTFITDDDDDDDAEVEDEEEEVEEEEEEEEEEEAFRFS